jgi:hypothetical protein
MCQLELREGKNHLKTCPVGVNKASKPGAPMAISKEIWLNGILPELPPHQRMNTTIAFPAAKPELKLPSHSVHPHRLEDRRRLEEDIEALRLRESNLREYEAHLRDWQEQIAKGNSQSSPPHYIAPAVTRSASGTPFESDPALNSAWEKLIRARELLEAEQAHLRDDRLTLKETAAVLRRREEALAIREARLAQREETVSAAVDAKIVEHTTSAFARLTQAPFAIAKSVFGKSKTD